MALDADPDARSAYAVRHQQFAQCERSNETVGPEETMFRDPLDGEGEFMGARLRAICERRVELFADRQ